MNKTSYSTLLTGLLLLASTLACAMPSTLVPQPETETALPTANPTDTPTLVPAPVSTEPVASDTPTPGFAPYCDPNAASSPAPPGCQLPIAEQSTVFCTNKVPYNLIFINEGATYETLSENFECSDAGMKDGKQMVTCTGPMATSFEVEVCDTACAIPTVQAETTQCPQGFNYDNLQGCCSPESQPTDQSCVVLTLRTKSCVVDCSEFTKKSTCSNNSFACEWDDNNSVCQLKR